MFCPTCGGELRAIPYMAELWWAQPYRCARDEGHTYINILDERWVYPLLPLERGVAEAFESADEETLRAACGRIKRIDYKTVSIVFFERTLLGIYEGAEREYRVVYPED